MPLVSLKAHFDGERILLDEPCDIPRDAELVVTVLPKPPVGFEQDWCDIATRALAEALGDDEPEYTAADLRP